MNNNNPKQKAKMSKTIESLEKEIQEVKKAAKRHEELTSREVISAWDAATQLRRRLQRYESGETVVNEEIESLKAKLEEAQKDREQFIRDIEDMAHEIGRLETTNEALQMAIEIIHNAQ